MVRTFSLCCVFLIASTLPAFADFCVQAHNAQRLEAQVKQSSTVSDATFQTLYEAAAELRNYHITNESMRDAVLTYVRSSMAIRDSPRYETAADRMAAHNSGTHQVALRYLNAFVAPYCAAKNDVESSTTSYEGQQGGISPLRSLFYELGPVATTAGIGLFLALVGGLGAAIFFRQQKRRLQLVRHDCYETVQIGEGEAAFKTTAINVSARGLKVKNPEQAKWPSTVTLTLGQRKYHARVAWQNAHFVGLMLTTPLSLKYVRRLSKGRNRSAARLGGARKRSGPKTAKDSKATTEAQTAPQH